MNKAQRSWRLIFWGLAVALHLGAWAWQWQGPPWLLADSQEYLHAAENLATHGTLYSGNWDAPLRLDHYTKRPPAYPLILAGAGAYRETYGWIWLLQNMLSLATLVLVFRSIREYTQRQPPYALGAILLLLTPGQWIYPQLIMTEIWFQASLFLLFLALWRGWETGAWSWGLLGVAMVLFAAFTKPVWYLFALPWLGYGLWQALRRRAWTWAVLALLPLLAVGSYMTWNQARTGYLHFSSIQNLSLLQYSTTNLLIQEYGEAEGIRKADSLLFASLREPSWADEQRLVQAGCAEVIGAHLPGYLRMHLQGMVNFFLDPGRFDLWEMFRLPPLEGGLLQAFSEGGYAGVWARLRNSPWPWLLVLTGILLANVFKVVALLVFALRARPWAMTLSLIAIIGYLALLTGTSGAARFALPLFPLLLFASAFLPSFHRRKDPGRTPAG